MKEKLKFALLCYQAYRGDPEAAVEVLKTINAKAAEKGIKLWR